MRLRRISATFMLLVCGAVYPAAAQMHVHFGVEAGVPLTGTLSSSSVGDIEATTSSFDVYHSGTKRLVIGPVVRLAFQNGFGVEFESLYQRVDYDHTANILSFGVATVSGVPIGAGPQTFEQGTANRWQFPLLLSYSAALPRTRARVIFKAGPSISHLANAQSTSVLIAGSGSPTNKATIAFQGGTVAGFTAGAGVELVVFHAHLTPEFRYSHWFSAAGTTPQVASVSEFIIFDPYVPTSTSVIPSFRLKQDEASIMLGVTF